MTVPAAQADLATAFLIGLIGSMDGDVDELLIVSKTMWKRGVGALLLLGGLDLPLSRDAADAELDRINAHLQDIEQTLYLYGSHTDSGTDIPIGTDGVGWIRSNVAALPDAFRATLRTRATIATVLGADLPGTARANPGDVSVDEPSELGEAEHLGLRRDDIVIGGAKLSGLQLAALAGGKILEEGEVADVDDLAAGEAIRRLRPKIYLGTHDTMTVDDTVTIGPAPAVSETRVILLSRQDPSGLNQGILHVPTFEISLFTYDDDTVTELTGGERGTWIVQTQSSRYTFDFGRRSVTRHPGPNAPVTINDTTRRLRHIDSCRVGQSGAWTMKADGGYADPVDFYWAVSTEIRSISRVTDSANA